jgi:hypothetical protein
MSERKTLNLDPMRAWRDWFIGAERQWSESLSQLMKDEAVARAMGQDFNATLHRQKMFAEVVGQTLAAMNLPSRDEILALGERMGRIEDGLAAVQASITQLRLSPAVSAAVARPPRTRQPAKPEVAPAGKKRSGRP